MFTFWNLFPANDTEHLLNDALLSSGFAFGRIQGAGKMPQSIYGCLEANAVQPVRFLLRGLLHQTTD